MPLNRGAKKLLEASLGVDYRSLAFWRMCIALVVAGDLWDRFRNLHEHYTEEGIWPAQNYFVDSRGGERFFLIPQVLNDHYWFQNLLGWIHFFCCAAMFLGWRTRLSTFLVWFLLCGLQFRTNPVLHSGDDFLRIIVFICILLPTNKYFSLDATRRRTEDIIFGRSKKKRKELGGGSMLDALSPPSPSNSSPSLEASLLGLLSSSSSPSSSSDLLRSSPSINDPYLSTLKPSSPRLFFSGVTLFLIGQLGAVYAFSVFFKKGREWHEDGTAVGYALQLDYFRTPVTDFMASLLLGRNSDGSEPWTWGLLRFLTSSVYIWELGGPLLYFSPWKPQFCKFLGVLGFVCLHLGFGSCLWLGTFMAIGLTAHLCLLPSFVWEYFTPRLRRAFVSLSSSTSRSSIGRRGNTTSRRAPTTSLALVQFDPWHPFARLVAETFSAFFLIQDVRVTPQVGSGTKSSGTTGEVNIIDNDTSSSVLCFSRPLVGILVDQQTGNTTTIEGFAVFKAMCLNSPILWFYGKLLEFIPPLHSVVSSVWNWFERRGTLKREVPAIRCVHCNRWMLIDNEQSHEQQYHDNYRQSRTNSDKKFISSVSGGLFKNKREFFSAFGVFLFLTLIVINVASLHFKWKISGNQPHDFFMGVRDTLQLGQAWAMFSPGPPRDDSWVVIALEVDSALKIEPTKRGRRQRNSPISGTNYYVLVDGEKLIKARRQGGNLAEDLSEDAYGVFLQRNHSSSSYVPNHKIAQDKDEFLACANDAAEVLFQAQKPGDGRYPYGPDWGKTTKTQKPWIQNHRWMKVWESIYDNQPLQQSVAETICNRWNGRARRLRNRILRQKRAEATTGRELSDDETEQEGDKRKVDDIVTAGEEVEKVMTENNNNNEYDTNHNKIEDSQSGSGGVAKLPKDKPLSEYRAHQAIGVVYLWMFEPLEPFEPTKRQAPRAHFIERINCPD